MDAADPESLRDKRFARCDVSGSWFTACDLSGVVVRGSDVAGMQIDSPWLGEGGSRLRQSLVRSFLADVTADRLQERRDNPHEPSYDETVASCVQTILEEEWEHLRYAVRDLDTLADAAPRSPSAHS